MLCDILTKFEPYLLLQFSKISVPNQSGKEEPKETLQGEAFIDLHKNWASVPEKNLNSESILNNLEMFRH